MICIGFHTDNINKGPVGFFNRLDFVTSELLQTDS